MEKQKRIVGTKRRGASKLKRRPNSSATAEKRKIRLLEQRLNEALEQQIATSEVLQVISNSPGELQSVFDAVVENATRICEAKLGNLFLREGHGYRAVSVHGESVYVESWRRQPTFDLRENPGMPLY